MWFALLRSPLAWALAALAGMTVYAAVQHLGWEWEEAHFAQFRAQTESLGAAAKVKAAQEAARHAQDTQEVLDDLQTRNDALAARYASLRNANARGRGVPDPAPATATPGPEPAGQPDALARCVADTLEVLELGDRELAKYRELWELGKRN